ncbi:GAF domain-containing sensor histidine kinase [Peristeroidobacter agariperforans]|uniref:GAF domain-containing sensor histidine kinase n=1 Tax=Peristeroidobacter agariperforans TaxID=268404 RepID=UPI00101BD3C5|nr:ATP-binding protein [Peristeroidobacter agariperforans]
MSSQSSLSTGPESAVVANAEAGALRIPIPLNEPSRLLALQSYDIMDSGREPGYDDIALLASRICHTPMALITLINEDRQWFKSKVGLEVTETPRELAFCAHAILEPDKVLTVADARLDTRFSANPFVTGDPHIRFYAGAPLLSAEGHALGTLCVIDREPRHLPPEQRDALLALSRQVMALMEERRTSAALRGAMQALTRSEALFREAYENAPIGIALVSPEGEWLRVNQSLCDMLGYAADELTRTTFQAITHPEDLESDLLLVRRMLAREIRSYQMEKRYLHRTGHAVWALLSVSLVWDKQRPLYFISQIQDITERKNIERGKAEFLTMVSHELRTPVTALRGALGILAAGAAGDLPPKAQALTALADRNADRLHRLVNDILDVEKIESGAFGYRRTDIDLNQLVTQAAVELRPYADQYHVKIDVRSDLPRAFLHADADRLMQVLANLISNAVKHSPSGGTIDVHVTRTDQSIRVNVTDRGDGIPEEFRRDIFEKFAQANWTATNRKGGSGLGLNISRAIIQHHGGVLAFETEVGVGSTFYFELPIL